MTRVRRPTWAGATAIPLLPFPFYKADNVTLLLQPTAQPSVHPEQACQDMATSCYYQGCTRRGMYEGAYSSQGVLSVGRRQTSANVISVRVVAFHDLVLIGKDIAKITARRRGYEI